MKDTKLFKHVKREAMELMKELESKVKLMILKDFVYDSMI